MKYIFLTYEGYTEAPNCKHIENCQEIGIAEGDSFDEALDKFLDENDWVENMDFERSAIFGYEIGKRFN